MAFPFLDHELCIRADRVEIFLHDLLPVQEALFHVEPVALLTRILFYIVRNNSQRFLFAAAFNAHPRIRILKSDRHGNMDVAVNDAGHNEFSAKVGHLSLIIRKAGFIAHIDELSVFYRNGGCLRVVLICGEDFRILKNLVCPHVCHLLSFFSDSAWRKQYRPIG